MVLKQWALACSHRCYSSLLSLYPIEFRIRFRKEMCQVFRDCCRDAVQRGSLKAISALWIRTLLDLGISIFRERGRALTTAVSLRDRTSGVVESMVILAIIIFHLLVAGTWIAHYLPQTHESTGGFFLVSAAMGAALGGLGMLCSVLLSRFRRIQYRLILF